MQASCHCGNVTLTMSHCVEQVTSCNCSICHRFGTLWGSYKNAEVTVNAEPDSLGNYAHGDEYLTFHHCKKCGCVTHYTANEKAEMDRIAVNFRMVDPAILPTLETRYFDGADTWEVLRVEPPQQP